MSGDYDEFDRMLLRAGRQARAPSRLRRRALAAAAAGSVATLASVKVAGTTAVHGASGGLGKSILAVMRAATFKWTVVASVGAAALGTYVIDTQSAEPPPSVMDQAPQDPIAAAQRHPAEATRLAPTPSPSSIPSPGPTADALTVRATSTASQVDAPVQPQPSRDLAKPGTIMQPPAHASSDATVAPSTSRGPAASEGRPRLADEIRLVDAARRALAQGDPSLALRLVEEHEADHPAGAFAVERDVLRVDALLAAGRTSEAAARARLLLARHGNAAQAQRLARIAAGEATNP
jgi:hypothetical protein